MLYSAVSVAVRRPTMTVLAEIVGPIAQEKAIQTAVEAFCKAVDGELIGRRVNEKTRFIVRLPHTIDIGKNRTPLNQAFNRHIIESFRYRNGDLVQITFERPVNLQEQMETFPLRPDEIWFPAIDDPSQVYVCLSKPLMLAKQSAWLLVHPVKWAYV